MSRADVYPNADRWACLLFVAVCAVALALLQGCVSAPALEHARRARAVNTGIAAKEDLAPDVRGVAEDNADAWSALLYLLAGEPLPEATATRLRKRGELPAEYDESP